MENYDLVVIGGGTAGCAAAYIAAKLGLKVLLVEKNIHLGGTITSGLVVPAMKSSDNQINTEFFTDLTYELKSIGGQVTFQGNPGWFNPELLKIALDSLMAKAGVECRFSTIVSSITLDKQSIKTIQLKNVILSEYTDKLQNTKEELSVSIGTRYVVDSTGNCEIGKILNCNFLENKSEIQPFSLRFIMSGVDLKVFAKWLLDTDSDRNVTVAEEIDGNIHLSTACTWDEGKNWALSPLFKDAVTKGILKPADTNYFQVFTIPGMPDSLAFNCPRIVDIPPSFDSKVFSKTLIEARKSILRLSNFCKIYFPGFDNAYISNIADMLGIRVSRRIKGKYIYTLDDILEGKKFDNPVVVANYPVDVHSKDKNASTLKIVKDYQIPIESLMSDDIDNLFVAGRCLSADFMAQGAARVQTSCFSMGEGIARYIAAKINS